jgi:hypothetical protein
MTQPYYLGMLLWEDAVGPTLCQARIVGAG